MSWKKYFTPVQTEDNPNGSYGPISGANSAGRPGPAKSNYSSYLPDVYVGSPNRVERYGQYNTMDMDSEVNLLLISLLSFAHKRIKPTVLILNLHLIKVQPTTKLIF